MAILRTPDGRTIQVPDGASPGQIEAIFKASAEAQSLQRTREAADMAWEDASTLERVGVGIAKPFVETWKGVKSLVSDLDDEDKADLARLESVKGAAGTTGEVIGNVAMFAAPGGVAGRVGTKVAAAGARRGLPTAARLATDATAAAGIEATRAHGKGQDAGAAATMGAVGTGLGYGAGRVLGKTLEGIRRSRTGNAMLERGVPLTPGQASAGKVIPWLENHMKALPITAGRTQGLQREAIKGWNREVLQSVTPLGKEITESGTAGFKQVQKAFSEGYEQVWQDGLTFNPTNVWKDTYPHVMEALGKKAGNRVVRNMAEVDQFLQRAPKNPKVLEHVDDKLREFAKKAARDGDDQAATFYKQVRHILHNALPGERAKLLKYLDAMYARYSVVRKAGTYKAALEDGGVFTPSHLESAVKSKGSEQALARGEALLQKEAADFATFFGDLVPGSSKLTQDLHTLGALGGAMVLDGGITASGVAGGYALPREAVRRMMLGETSLQGYGRLMAEQLRKTRVTPANVGAAVGAAAHEPD